MTDVPPPTEISWAIWNPIDAYTANELATEAGNWAAANYPGAQLHNGRGDAARHAYWNALMAQELGAATAEEAATAHEHTGLNEGSPHNETVMDMNNNAVGRTLAAPTRAQMQTNVQQALDAGQLWILDKITNPSRRGLLINSDE